MVVFYANYLKFLDRARTEWLRELGINQFKLAETQQRLFVVHSLDISYRKHARLDDLLIIHSRITRLGRASIHFAQRAERDAEGSIQICCVDAIRMRTAEIPAEVRALLESIQE